MPFSREAREAIKFLLKNQNDDGGLPAVNPGDPSAKWTTSQAMIIFTSCPYFPSSYLPYIYKLIQFLLNSQDKNHGGWPFGSGKIGATITTAYPAIALIRAMKILPDSQLKDEILETIELGITWLKKRANIDGGWGIEPESTAKGGQISRIYTTFLAMWALIEHDENNTQSKEITNAINFILDARNEDFGEGYYKKV